MTPKIDYALLAEALHRYEERGYQYVEVPWAVEERFIRATLPDQYPTLTLFECTPGAACLHRSKPSGMVGSAEQGFLALGLPPGRYVGISPCFRPEPVNNLFYQDMFMKIELHDTSDEASVARVIEDARWVMDWFLDHDVVDVVSTEEGFDLELGGIEVGSYGERTFEEYRWVYGTGIALPRFSVARALSTIIDNPVSSGISAQR